MSYQCFSNFFVRF